MLYKESQEDLKFYLIIFGCLELLTGRSSYEIGDGAVSKSISTIRQLEPIDETRLSMVREEDNKEEEQIAEGRPENEEDPYNGRYFHVVTTQSDEEEGKQK